VLIANAAKMIRLQPEQIESWVAKNFEYKRKKDGRELLICNPDGDTKYNLRISTEYKVLKNKYDKNNKPIYGYWVNDFRVNHQHNNGSLISFIKKYKKISYFDALAELTGTSARHLRDLIQKIKIDRLRSEPKVEVEDEPEVELPPLSVPLAKKDGSRLRQIAINYLGNRMITEEIAIEHQLHYTPVAIVFPYIEYGVLVYWQMREILDKRFLFPDEAKTGLAKTDFLYNFDNVEQPADYVIVVESIFNCLSIGDNCIATGGAKIPERAKQIGKLNMLSPKEVILAPDMDEAGIMSLKFNYYALKDQFSLAYCLPPDNLDWNDLEQKHGIGSARRYIEGNTKRLSLNALLRLLERFQPV
jgi:hypothetical protein